MTRYTEVRALVMGADNASTDFIARRLCMSLVEASEHLARLEAQGFVGPFVPLKRRLVLKHGLRGGVVMGAVKNFHHDELERQRVLADGNVEVCEYCCGEGTVLEARRISGEAFDADYCEVECDWCDGVGFIDGDASDEARSGVLRTEPEVSALRAPAAIAKDGQ